MFKQFALAAIAYLAFLHSTAPADLVLTMYESGANVVTTWSGAVNTTGLGTRSSATSATVGRVRGQSNLWNAITGDFDFFNPTGVTFNFNNPSPSFFNFVGTVTPGSGSVGMQNASAFIVLPKHYVDDTPISGTITAAGTFASLGIKDGITSTASWDAGVAGIQTMTFITNAAIPEPSALLYGVLISGVVGCVYHVKRRLP